MGERRAAIELTSVSKTYGAVEALAGIDLEVAASEIVTVLGPSGSGKTTLLRIVGGLEEPTVGRVSVDGASPHDARAGKRIGFVPQSPALFPWRTVAQNARVLLDVNRQPGDPPGTTTAELLDRVGLASFAGAYPHELSGGMQQRVALVRAVALGAPLLLMDEPFAALDEITRTDMRHLLAALCEPLATTVLFVTHSIPESVFLSDRVVVLSSRPGRIVGIETIDLPRPRHPELEDTQEFFAVETRLRALLHEGTEAPVTTRWTTAAALTGIVLFGLVWELVVRVFDVQPFILMPPSRIVAELFERPRFYLEAAGVTARQATVGLLIALGIAILLGAALASSRFAEHATQPVLVLILVAPWVAYFTSIVVWLGSGDPPVIFLVAFVTTPAFVFATVAGLRSADPAARELLASVDASWWEVLWRLRLPSALPAVLAATRYSLGLALAAAYYGEGGNLTTAGLGAVGRRAINAQNGPVLWATVLATMLLGVAGLGVISVIERTLLRWHVSQRRSLR